MTGELRPSLQRGLDRVETVVGSAVWKWERWRMGCSSPWLGSQTQLVTPKKNGSCGSR